MASSSSSNTDSLMEERKDMMISSKTNVKTFRKAHFLKPSVTSLEGHVSRSPLTYSQAGLAKVKLHGWGAPVEGWKQWVSRIVNQQKSVWTRAGVYDAIINSTYKIQQNNKLILWLAERWCPETNTFVFSWGETTITLEDVLILGCFSVMGDSVFDPRANEDTEEIHRRLLDDRKELGRSGLRKATQTAWMEKFRDKGTEIEHVACLVYWLSRFTFPSPVSGSIINKDVLRAAICLYKGNKIALAPAVLASLYADLSTLKEALQADPQSTTKRDRNGFLQFYLSSPLKLVQVWAWERFTCLQPIPKPIGLHEPIMARWDGLSKVDIEDILPTLDSPTTRFLWRPYVTMSDSLSHGLYRDREQYRVSIDSELDEELEVLIRCMRVSELVSLNKSNIKQYLPHRVAMQFGMDQDIPGIVDRDCASARSAWMNYSRPIGNEAFYLPARHSHPSVTKRYLSWWKTSVAAKNNSEQEGKDSDEEVDVYDGDVANITAQGPAKQFEGMVSTLGKTVHLIKIERGNS